MKELSQLKICFLAGTLGQGGAERQLFYMLQALRQNGADVRLLCMGKNEFWEDRIQSLGVPVTWVGEPKSKLQRLFRVIEELRKHPLQIFQSQHFYTSAYVGAAARWLGLCGIGALRADGVNEVRVSGRVGGWLSLRTPRLMAANSRAAIKFAVENGVRPERLYFLPNVVDTAQFKPSPKVRENGITLLTVGRLVPQKRMDRFLIALARLRTTSTVNVKGLIVGAGPLKEALSKQAESLGLTGSALEFRDRVSNMGPVYQEADISVLTSDFEGTPNVLLEAMSAGLPVVATSVDGVPDIVRKGKDGFLIDPSDGEGLFSSLERLIKDSGLRTELGKNARAGVQENHSLESLPAKLSGLYQLTSC